ncbi:MAG TPA: ABC transporter permease [Candidatus Obscuribacterales bacterium]
MKQLDAVQAIAINTFRETVRDRILYAFILFACMATIFGIVLGSLSVGQDVRILKDIGLSAIATIGGVIAVFAGTNLVYKELERRTIYIIFTKPVSGWQFILGKYIGLCLCVLVMVAAMGGFLALLLSLQTGAFQGGDFSQPICELTQQIGLIYLELLFVTALATFFSTFTTPVMSVLFTVSLWLSAHMGDSLIELGKLSQNPVISTFLQYLFWLLPDFGGLTRIRAQLLYGRAPDGEVITYLMSYIFAYIILILTFAALVTEQREFT